VNALSRKLNITQPAVSQHLRILKQANLVIPEKKGYFVHYAVNTEAANEYLEKLKKLFHPDGGKVKCAVKKRKRANTRKD
jgi:DNA-binding transcriptional ArsR family regulator